MAKIFKFPIVKNPPDFLWLLESLTGYHAPVKEPETLDEKLERFKAEDEPVAMAMYGLKVIGVICLIGLLAMYALTKFILWVML